MLTFVNELRQNYRQEGTMTAKDWGINRGQKQEDVIQQIKNGDLLGYEEGGEWFVDGYSKASGHKKVITDSNKTAFKDSVCPKCGFRNYGKHNTCQNCKAPLEQGPVSKKVYREPLSGKKVFIKILQIAFVAVILWAIYSVYSVVSGSSTPKAKTEQVMKTGVFNSEWDASVFQVKKWLENNVKDRSSLEYIEWSQVQLVNDFYYVRCKFRAKNSFGAFEIENRLFKLSKDGSVLEAGPFGSGH